jgi:hypothetical protein
LRLQALKVERHDRITIEPIKDVVEAQQFEANNAYAIPINDHQAYEMTGKILLLDDHNFYIEEKFLQ